MKGKSIIEVLVVCVCYGVFFRWFNSYLKDLGLGPEWRNLIYGMQAVLVPLVMIWLTKTDAGFREWKRGVHIGFIVLWLGVIQSMGFAAAAASGADFSSRPAFAILVTAVGLMIALVLWIFKRVDDSKEVSIKWKLSFLLGSLLIPIVVAWIGRKSVSATMGWELYFLMAIGFGEEALYRGYIQSRVNHEFGRPWRFCGVEFGAGRLVGAAHAWMLRVLLPGPEVRLHLTNSGRVC